MVSLCAQLLVAVTQQDLFLDEIVYTRVCGIERTLSNCSHTLNA